MREAREQGQVHPDAARPGAAGQIVRAARGAGVFQSVVAGNQRHAGPEVALGHANVHLGLFQCQQLGFHARVALQSVLHGLFHSEFLSLSRSTQPQNGHKHPSVFETIHIGLHISCSVRRRAYSLAYFFQNAQRLIRPSEDQQVPMDFP